VFILGALYEGIKEIRQYWQNERQKRLSFKLHQSTIIDDENENELTRLNIESPTMLASTTKDK
jgi:hypothetical protein